MKYLLLIGLLLFVLWLLRQQRSRSRRKSAHPPSPPASAPTEIIECARCAVHLPRAEAVAGQRGHYCCPAHRLESEGG